jgi:hypothetical protein
MGSDLVRARIDSPFSITNCTVFFWKDRLDARRFKHFFEATFADLGQDFLLPVHFDNKLRLFILSLALMHYCTDRRIASIRSLTPRSS